MRRGYALLSLLALFIAVTTWVSWPREEQEPDAGRDGRREAEADPGRGQPKYKLYGSNAGVSTKLSALLQVRFGVTAEPIADCVIGSAIFSYAQSYNATIEK